MRKALREVWQANKWGKYEHPDDRTDAPLDPNFKGWGRVLTDAEGRYRLRSIKPGPRIPTRATTTSPANR